MITEKALVVRKASLHDKVRLFNLYKLVSNFEDGIARTQVDITEDWVINCLLRSLENGVTLVIPNPEKEDELLAAIHTYNSGLELFSHVFGDLFVAVNPDDQGRGLGKLIFESLLEEVKNNHTDILRIELIVRESNERAINFYEKLGFVKEGRFENRIRNLQDNSLEADIPMAWFNPHFAGK